LKKDTRPIILAGCYRSGTTLLRNIVNEHENIFSGPEVKFFEDFYGTFLNDPLKHKRFFRTISTLKIPKKRILRIFGNGYVKSLNIAAKRAEKDRWADKNPENVLYMDDWDFLLKRKFLYVFIVRHPLDTLASLVEIGFNKSLPKPFEGKLDIVHDFIKSGYKYYLEHPQKSYMIKYENLIQNPDEELKKLFKFLNEDYDPKIIKEVFKKNNKGGVGDPKFKKTNKIHTQSINRWKNDLKDNQLKLATKKLKDLCEILDYDI